MVRNAGDAVDLFISYQRGDVLDQARLVYHIRDLGYDDLALSVRQRFNVRYRANTDFTAAGTVSLVDTAGTEDFCSGREVRAFYNAENLLEICRTVLLDDIVNNFYNGTYHLAQIVRRDVRCHTDCDTGSTVYQKVRVAGRHNNRLFFGFIKVRGEVYGVFVDIRQHLHRDFA